ncbi:MAG TPA: Rv3654c family TadE-like protein [Mycobacteriales bacterium]|nr:Rv3654c family TadE-like protein [Mycobacteriales bacterium]
MTRGGQQHGDEGFSTVLALGFIAVILAVAGLIASFAAVVVSRHQAYAAADLASLAAAAHARQGQEAACAAARHVTRAQHVELTRCRLDGLDAEVETAVRPPGRLGGLGKVRAVARAGRR